MFIISTRNFPPVVGGMLIFIGCLATALVNHGPVIVFADNTDKFDENAIFAHAADAGAEDILSDENEQTAICLSLIHI